MAMQDKITIQIPAKINLFLHILEKRKDKYHNIETGITFINLFDEISIKKSDKTSIHYLGKFKPKSGSYSDCIIKKTLNFLELNKKVFLQIKITKNIPVQAGMGSASNNAAGLIKGLEKLKILNNIEKKQYHFLSADIPAYLYGKNSIVRGIGDKIISYKFPKYYFLLVKN